MTIAQQLGKARLLGTSPLDPLLYIINRLFIGRAVRRPNILRQIKIRNYLAMCLQQSDSCDAQRARGQNEIVMVKPNRIPKEIDMSKPKKTKVPKIIKDAAAKTSKAAKSATRKVKSAAEPKSNKTTQLVELLRPENGATLDELVAFTGWNANSVRGFLSGTVGKKMKLKVESSKGEDGKRKYQIAS